MHDMHAHGGCALGATHVELLDAQTTPICSKQRRTHSLHTLTARCGRLTALTHAGRCLLITAGIIHSATP